jgi:hypothetical protein
LLKEQFRRELRSRLSQVPLETRRGWTDVELRGWWLEEQRADPQLRWAWAPADQWHYVKVMCHGLYGEDAI